MLVDVAYARLKELDPEMEPTAEQLQHDQEIDATVKETVITTAPSQYVSDRNRDRPQTPSSPPRGDSKSEVDVPEQRTPDSPTCTSSAQLKGLQ